MGEKEKEQQRTNTPLQPFIQPTEGRESRREDEEKNEYEESNKYPHTYMQ